MGQASVAGDRFFKDEIGQVALSLSTFQSRVQRFSRGTETSRHKARPLWNIGYRLLHLM